MVDELVWYLATSQSGLRGFTRRNLFRTRQFYETYRDDQKVSALLTQIQPSAIEVVEDAYVFDFLSFISRLMNERVTRDLAKVRKVTRAVLSISRGH